MKNYNLFLLFFHLVFTASTGLFGQSNYSTQSLETLQQLKVDAVNASDYTTAAAIKKEIDLREGDEKNIEALEMELDQKVKEEDYTAAASIKQKLDVLKENKIKKEELKKQLSAAIANQDFENAAKYKTQLDALNTPSGSVRSPSSASGGVISYKSGDAQIPFEGIMKYEIYFQKGDDDKSIYTGNYQATDLMKKDKRRIEKVKVNKEYNTNELENKIINCVEGNVMNLLEKNIIEGEGKSWKFATVNKIAADPNAKRNVVFIEDYKIIAGYNCQKALYTYQSKTMSFKLEGYVCRNFTSIGYECQKEDFIFMEWKMNGAGGMQTCCRNISFSPEPLNDELFSTVPPEGCTDVDKMYKK